MTLQIGKKNVQGLNMLVRREQDVKFGRMI